MGFTPIMFVALCLFCISCMVTAHPASEALNSNQASDLPFHATLDTKGQFQIFWSFDKDSITIQYHAMTKGWAGLGFSPNGAMPGADIALFWVDESGNSHVSVSIS